MALGAEAMRPDRGYVVGIVFVQPQLGKVARGYRQIATCFILTNHAYTLFQRLVHGLLRLRRLAFSPGCRKFVFRQGSAHSGCIRS